MSKTEWEKKRKCKHEFEEIRRSHYDENGKSYRDLDVESDITERVDYRCKKCGVEEIIFDKGDFEW